MSLQQELIRFVNDRLLDSPDAVEIDANTSLVEAGLIDSMGLMQLVAFLEEEGGIRVPDREVTPDNFDSVASIEMMVKRLKERQA